MEIYTIIANRFPTNLKQEEQQDNKFTHKIKIADTAAPSGKPKCLDSHPKSQAVKDACLSLLLSNGSCCKSLFLQHHKDLYDIFDPKSIQSYLNRQQTKLKTDLKKQGRTIPESLYKQGGSFSSSSNTKKAGEASRQEEDDFEDEDFEDDNGKLLVQCEFFYNLHIFKFLLTNCILITEDDSDDKEDKE